jgi:hypothetical protein
MREGQTFSATEENIDINIYTVSNRKGKYRKKIYFNETNRNFVEVVL